MIKFILLFLILPLVHAEKPWKQCYGVEYLHYDKHCCDTQDGYSDSDRHCIESLPKLEYDKAITVLNSTLHAMTICNSANTCSEDIDFLEIVRQVENLHNITNGGATLAEGAADHLEAQSANLNTINTGILPSISLAPAATLHSLTGSSIIVQSGATFDFPSIQFTGTANDPSVQAHLEIGSIESQVDFHTHELSDVNLEENTLRLQHAPVTISASELNVLQNASVSAAELSKLVGMDTTTQELNQLAGLALTSQQVASVHGLPIDYTASATTRYAGSTASTLSEAKDACDADAQCDGYSDTWSQSLTFSITNGKVMPGSRGTHTAMPNNHISDCTNLITDNSHYGILVDTGSNTCQLITDGNRDVSTWTDDASKKLYVRNSEISYGSATTGLPIISYVKGIGRSAASKVVTADINGNVQIMQDVTIEGDLDVPVGEINIEGTALVVTAVQLNQAGQLHGELTASLQEINTLDGVLSTVAELNTMSGVTADTADLNRADITTPGISAASKVVTADVTGKVVLQDAQASVDASVFNLNGASVDAATLNKASGLTAPLNTINNALLGAEAMTFNVDLSVDALNVAEGNLKIGTEAIAATAAEMNVLDGVTLTTQQLSKLKTMPTTIDTTVVNGLYATTAELNYVDLAGSIGSAEASKVISSDATTLAKIQVLDAATVDAAMTYSLRSTGDYDPKMTLQDCQDAAIGTFTANINTDASPKGCVHITGLRLYNEHATGSGTCAGVYACIVKGFAAGELKIKGANMPSAEVLNHLDVTLQATHDNLNHWQSLDAAVLASHLNPMQGLTAEKADLDRLDIAAEGQVEASKVVTTDASDALEFGVRYSGTTTSYAGTACSGTSNCETECSAHGSCAGYSGTLGPKSNAGIVAWGTSGYGGSDEPTSGTYVSIFSTERAFAAIKEDGSITVWGNTGYGGSDEPTDDGYVNMGSTEQAFAAMKADGSITAWGHSGYGGSGEPTDDGYVSIVSTQRAFAAMKADGSITAWGGPDYGGDDAPTTGTYVSIFSTKGAFAAIKDDKSITAWGDSNTGGSGAPTDDGYATIYSNKYAFAALKDDGSITAWGYFAYGGDGAPTTGTYVTIVSGDVAFAALSSTGSITAWGSSGDGGDDAPTTGTYVSIFSTERAFAALKDDGSITAWGNHEWGGSGSPDPTLWTNAPTDDGYVNIFSTNWAFAALKEDGSITAWGQYEYGGDDAPTDDGYVSIFSTERAFAAIKDDGSITAWGSSSDGVFGAPTTGIYNTLISTKKAFAAIPQQTNYAYGPATGTAGGFEKVAKRMIMTSSTDAIEVSSLAFEADVSPTAMNKMDAVDATTEELNYAGNMLTADASANVGIAGDVSVTGAIEIGSGGSGRIGLGGTDIVINAVQLDSALSLHKSLTITAAEANTLDNIQATTAELNKMAGAQVTTAELNYLDTTVGATEASKAAIYGSELLFADLASTEIDAATLKLSGVAVTSTASELNIASGIPSDLIPELNKLSSAPSTALLNTFAATTSTIADLNLLDGVDPDLDIADLNKLKDLSSTATELNKLSTASSAAQLNAMSTTATAVELNAAVLVAGSDAAISVTDATIATLDTTNIANDLTVTAAELDAHAADLGSVLSSGITAFTSASNIDSIDKLRPPSTAQYNILAGLGSASDVNAYAAIPRSSYADYDPSTKAVQANTGIRCDLHDACKAACDADSTCEIYQENIYYDSTKVFGGTDCTDPAACETQCTADAGCEGWTSACGDTSKITEETCGTCGGSGTTENTCGTCSGAPSRGQDICELDSVVDVASGIEASCYIDIDGMIFCMGNNEYGILGNGVESDTNALVPTAVTMLAGLTATQISMASYSTFQSGYRIDFACAIMSDDNIYCWGGQHLAGNRFGTSPFTSDNRLLPTAVTMPVGLTGKQINVAEEHTCAIMSDDNIYCWGDNTHGQLGIGNYLGKHLPTAVTMPTVNGNLLTAKHVALGYHHTCAIMSDDNIYCWGEQDDGILGIGSYDNNMDELVPTIVTMPAGLTAKQLDTSYKANCAIMSDDNIYCWGTNPKLDTTVNSVPTAVTMPTVNGNLLTAKQVASLGFSNCAIMSDDNIYCWGEGIAGGSDHYVPNAITMPSGLKAKKLGAGQDHICSIMDDDSLYCFGENEHGQLGIDSTVDQSTPQAVQIAAKTWAADTWTAGTWNSALASSYVYGSESAATGGTSQVKAFVYGPEGLEASASSHKKPSSDFCDNKLPGTLVSQDNDLYMCLGDECAETSTCEYRENGNIDKTVFKTRTCSHDMQHYTGLRDECPVGKCRIDERHQVKKTCHQDAEGSIAFNGEIGVAAGQCERKYEYSDSTAVFSGTACTDASDCETQCAADANCEGYTSRCDDPSKTTEDTCGTCLDPAKTSESTCGDCPHLGYQASAVTSHTTPDTSGWPAYDCSSPATSGTFILNGDCTLSAEVILDGDLTIVGSSQDMSTLKTMTAASTKRHFKVDGGRTLELWYVKLTGGDVSSHSASTDPSLGGAIFTSSSNGNTNTVNVYFSEISGNKAYNGGGIYSRGYDDNQLSLLNIRNSIVKDNVATGIGGGISGRRASITIMDTTIDDNEANYGGGLQLDFSVSTVTNTIISNNEAVYGGAITILNVIGATILRQVTFDGNEATTSNDEIFGWGNDEDLFLINTVMPSDAEIGDFDGSVVPISITCSDNPCTVAPYTGACAAVDANNDILGVTCAHYSTNENTCGTCDDTSLITKTNCEASGTWTSAWNAGTWTAGVWADIGSAYAFGESTGTGGSSKQRDDATLAIEVTEDCTSSASVHCSDPEQVTTNTYGYASSVKVFDGASCSDLADCQQQCTDNPSCEGYTSACSLVDKTTQDTCGTCDVAGKSTELTCGTCVGDTSKETEATCVSECQDSSFTTEATCGTCDDTNEGSSTTCVDTCYDYSSSTKVFDGASCNDLADCQQQCTDDLACEGYTSQCSLSSKTTEETCGSCSDSTKTTETTCGACDKGVCSDATRQPDDCLYNFVQNTDLASAVANTVDLTITEQECRDIQAAYDATATFNVATNDAGPRGCVKLAANTNYYYRANGAHSRTDCTTAAAVCSDTSYTTETTCEAANKIWTAATFSPTHVCIKKSGNTVSTLDSSTTCVGTCSTSNYNTAATCGTCNDANMLSAATCVGTGCFSDTSQTTSGTCLTAGFSQNTITNSVNMAFSVYAADLDGDGDIDVLSASYSDNKIAWYKNDGSESFTAYTITTSATGATSVYAADVDGDGDMDVLSSSNLDDTIRWYENDGLADPTFTARTISTDADGAWSVYAADVDGDGDMDVLSASPNDNTIRWYENDGNSDPTFTARTITTSATGARSVYAADVDGDGDMDVLSASFNDHKIAWYENDGSESFTAHTITTSALGAYSVYAADVDGDGDMDVLSASGNTDEPIVWYENNGNSDPTFTARTITTADEYDQYYSVYAADVDGDGDMDVLSASDSGNNDDKIAWYENDGAADPTFTAHTITTLVYGAHAVYAVDVDGDGDMDVLSASTSHVNRIAWYENDNTWTARTWSPLTWVDRTWTADTWTAGTWDTQLSSIYAYGTESTYTGGTSQERSVASSCAGVPASRRFPRTWSALSWTQRDWQVGSWENGEWDTQLSSVYAYGTESTYTGGTSQARSLSSTELTYEDTCPSGTSTSSVSCLAMETPPTAALFTSGSQDFSLNAAECEQFAADNNYIFELRNDNNINQVSEGCILRNANWEDPQKIYYVDPDYTGHDQNGGQYYDCGSVINANINYPCVKRLQCPSTHVYGSYAMAYEPSCTASDYKTCEAIAAEDKTLCLEQGCADGSTKDKAACEAAGESYDSSTAANVFYHTEQVNSEAECDGEHTWGYKKFTIRV